MTVKIKLKPHAEKGKREKDFPSGSLYWGEKVRKGETPPPKERSDAGGFESPSRHRWKR